MLLRRFALLAALCLSTTTLGAQPLAKDAVRIEGEVEAAGDYAASGGRLSSAIIAANPKSTAFLPGASFTRASSRSSQLRLKAGLEYTLGQLVAQGDLPLQGIASRLQQWVQTHPATGRVPILPDARLMQAQPQHDPVIKAGDSLRIPTRPGFVQVLGAVAAACTLPHIPLKTARQYLSDCPAMAGADRNELYVIQPDGLVQKLGIAIWNRADPQSIAPGGTLYVPISEFRLQSLDPNFNADFASFVATQPVNP